MLNPSLAERGSPFQSGLSALDGTQGEVQHTQPQKGMKIKLCGAAHEPCSALGALSWPMNSLAMARCLRAKLTSISFLFKCDFEHVSCCTHSLGLCLGTSQSTRGALTAAVVNQLVDSMTPEHICHEEITP